MHRHESSRERTRRCREVSEIVESMASERRECAQCTIDDQQRSCCHRLLHASDATAGLRHRHTGHTITNDTSRTAHERWLVLGQTTVLSQWRRAMSQGCHAGAEQHESAGDRILRVGDAVTRSPTPWTFFNVDQRSKISEFKES